jgi:Uma2 family endonuclease
MAIVSTAASRAGASAFTWDDLQQAPDDNLRRELVGGQLLVTPSPSNRHQAAVLSLARLLADACPADLRVMLSPCAWKLSATTVFEPDLMVVRRSELDLDRPFTGMPLLVVEVRSPSTAATDRTLKREQYALHGVVTYWLIDPGGPAIANPTATGAGAVPNLTVLRLADGAYAEEAAVHGDEPYRAELPFPVIVVPHRLVG